MDNNTIVALLELAIAAMVLTGFYNFYRHFKENDE